MASGSRPASMPQHDDGAGDVGEVVVQGGRERGHAFGVVGAVEDEQGLPAHDLEAAGDLQVGEGLRHDLGVERPVEEGLGGGDGHGQVVTLVGAVDGRNRSSSRPPRCAHVQGPAADGDPVVLRGEVPVPTPGALGALGLEDRLQLPVGLAEDQGRTGLDDPGLLARDGRPPALGPVGVVPTDVGDHGDEAVGHVGGVVPTEEADLDHGDIDGLLGEPGERGGGDQLEPGRLALDERLERGQLVEDARPGPRRGSVGRPRRSAR